MTEWKDLDPVPPEEGSAEGPRVPMFSMDLAVNWQELQDQPGPGRLDETTSQAPPPRPPMSEGFYLTVQFRHKLRKDLFVGEPSDRPQVLGHHDSALDVATKYGFDPIGPIRDQSWWMKLSLVRLRGDDRRIVVRDPNPWEPTEEQMEKLEESVEELWDRPEWVTPIWDYTQLDPDCTCEDYRGEPDCPLHGDPGRPLDD